ncbi:MAG: pyruvate dehydrogenase (acetyl-transferring), homodimeric type [Candidatus Omnitrophica bacterium CG11_big_fil_rev_8_21_14_0_20_45_26]|uniref:Pyruvate dehydrogenase E1 component n=1 Tax=Candidatus Abzuiibacterium crystallinum TaxID=1974748 RepID=A0A2H0LQ94_9BACT|nr:MAG: pyruvate dehydrogenase (acetyl-transferring), homodimeric type [Candidatus Omnitrophica bacterium CG11_big_fil_rev_8_21_14_0_20_45_26]PIW65238.1 MAG: pyruvate dehydrogenase (acetyl-transferring), homodimeric type [Candidatus Omnitrophica bacterium CG12_big_fil_rev_8_21_14_0_65_45_16]
MTSEKSDKKAQEATKDTIKWMHSLEYLFESILKNKDIQNASFLLDKIFERFRAMGIHVPAPVNTPYVNTIPSEKEAAYPGNREIERRIKSYVRWNAMAMVVNANRRHSGLGGHISTYASAATIYEVGFNHFFRGADPKAGRPADIIYFQGHASPGNYARAYLERRLSASHLHHFRQELAEGGGLSSYPHPYLMPDFWQYPSVSMGLSPIMSIYQARFLRYLSARGFIKEEPRVWCFVGDGESDEPETLGALTLAGREHLDNLVWVINCNLQRLDGPVRGNGKIIQELEGIMRGAGWNVIKVIWGSDWDALLKKDHHGLLVKRMEEAVDGDYQKYSVAPGSYIRKHFFGKYPELLQMVNHLTDDELRRLLRGGHDPQKVYNAYKAAAEHKGQPTVILAKTIKGYGLGEAGEGRNITHQQKKLNEKELREFRSRFDIPIKDEEITETPFYRPPVDSPENKYLLERRKVLGGFLPERNVKAPPLQIPGLENFKDMLSGSGELKAATTMAFVRMLGKLLQNKEIGKQVVPIIPDEARTFGMDALFRQIGIYSSKGQLYEPVDKESFLYYNEQKNGQILEEGISEAGSMSSFIAAGTAYSTLSVNMMPFFIYYSMFGFQRVGDLIWAAADSRAKGFLLGATAGRTTLSGEGLQHQDGHSLLAASTVPTIEAYDPAFAYEIAIITREGMKRMYQDGEEIIYYMTLYNELYEMPAMPKGSEEGILKGMYKFKEGPKDKKHKVHLLGSGPIIREALRAQEVLAKSYDVSADVWSVTSYKKLRSDALNAARWNMLHPNETPKKSYMETILANEKGAFVAVSDNMKIVADQIAPWVPGGLMTLGTDGFGRSDTREHLRRFFEIDAEMVVLATLTSLKNKGAIEVSVVQKAIQDLQLDPEKPYPQY